MNEPVPIRSHMSVAEYDRERAKLRELYGDTSAEAVAKRDQALALLFYRSGWTQQELADKEGKPQSWISRRCLFGRFLNFMPNGINDENLPKGITEGRFRAFWDQTDKAETNERARFKEVIRLMRETTSAPRRPNIGPQIKDQFADGKWHKLATIAQAVDAVDEDHAADTLDGMSKNQTYGCKAEKKKVGTHYEYRVFKIDKAIGSGELVEKLAPIIKELKEQGRKNMVTMSPPTVARLAHQLQLLLDEWAE